MKEINGTTILPFPFFWICCACGKRSLSQYGFDINNKRVADHGYDESCMLNSAIVTLDGDGIVVCPKEEDVLKIIEEIDEKM
jgi:hypothetical protein